MNIALDYDRTFSLDPNGWTQVVKLLEARGHKFYCVTNRQDIGESGSFLREKIGHLMPIIFAGPRMKADAIKEKNIIIDVWIDDCPEMIRNIELI